jgi:3-deoxy-7-phosphoheptulonate synthase
MDNFSLLEAVGAAGKPVLLKRGTRSTVHEWLMAAEYVAQRGTLEIVLCERGIRTFASAAGESTLDVSSVPVVQVASHLPVVVDPSHAAGRRELVVPLARAAIAAGADGVLVDVYADPDNALIDGDTSLGGRELRELASAVRQLPPLVSRAPAAPTA